MKRRIELSKTFTHLRQLPPEVSFARVELWVKNHAISPVKTNNNWLAAWLSHWRSLN